MTEISLISWHPFAIEKGNLCKSTSLGARVQPLCRRRTSKKALWLTQFNYGVLCSVQLSAIVLTRWMALTMKVTWRGKRTESNGNKDTELIEYGGFNTSSFSVMKLQLWGYISTGNSILPFCLKWPRGKALGKLGRVRRFLTVPDGQPTLNHFTTVRFSGKEEIKSSIHGLHLSTNENLKILIDITWGGFDSLVVIRYLSQ